MTWGIQTPAELCYRSEEVSDLLFSLLLRNADRFLRIKTQL